MTTKEWLRRGWKAEQEIRRLMQMRENLYLQAIRMTARYDGERTTGSADPHKLDGYSAVCDSIDRRVDELLQISAEILDAINSMDDQRFRDVLSLRYVEFHTWEQIADELHYSLRQVLRLHGLALMSLNVTIGQM